MWVTGKVRERIDWNDSLFTIKIEADIPRFKAGQFIKLAEQRDGKRLARAYSLVNAPDDPLLEVLAIKVEDGQLSPQLHQLQIGDSIELSSNAAGFMVVDEVPESRDLWLLATGTGVGPFLSMIDDPLTWQRFDNVVLCYGVRFGEDLCYLERIHRQGQAKPGRFHFVPLVTREAHPDSLQARIPPALLSGELESFAGLSLSAEHSHVMLCGNPQMISDGIEALQQKGLRKHLRREPGHITVERYW
ncbi:MULTISPECIES: ferredoxin--NADP reductase [Aliagarivorans]|uniref:ferredoxin--NADP reductase n=1 Tax=Aliagarivorans TaxID=882379 RepID=UPI00041047BF|nr:MULTISPECIES: ferredoxin--NADP reductase [Aliagarivorans]